MLSLRSSGGSSALRRVGAGVIGALALAAVAVGCAPHVDQHNAVHVLRADFEVGPVMERYIDRGLDEAERTDAKAVVIAIDTPGGRSSSMDHIVQRIQSAKVPVIVYVTPGGARAASAGTSITMSAHVAAMAPGTRIGAAHPIAGNGDDIGGTLGTKIENDAAAGARAIAEAHGRNADWAERAVRDSVSASTSEAVEMRIVDYAAENVDDLLRQADGRTVAVDGQQRTLAGLASAPRVSNDRTLAERFSLFLGDPNIVFLLLTLAGLGLLLEFLHPGLIAPGVVGAIALILAFFALGTLPVNWAGVALILLAFVLFAAELQVGGVGALGVGGVVSLVAGGLLLTGSDNPDFQVSRWLIGAVAAGMLIFFVTVVTAIVRMRRSPALMGTQAMVGASAVARSALDPEGFVFIRGERWKAIAEDAPIPIGEAVRVMSVRGLTLTVRRR